VKTYKIVKLKHYKFTNEKGINKALKKNNIVTHSFLDRVLLMYINYLFYTIDLEMDTK
jgi:hypothetical protein